MADKTLMIDTGLLIDYFRKTDKSNARLVQLSKQFDQLAISSVTEFEIYSGATSSQLTFWNELLSEIIVLPFDSKAAHVAAEIQQELKKIRKTVEKADLFIAATAISNNLSLDTLNRKHFEVIEQLALFSTSG
jgi:tRNA(fMet)-specific endonuclease VapC